jgi:hypothetical protein
MGKLRLWTWQTRQYRQQHAGRPIWLTGSRLHPTAGLTWIGYLRIIGIIVTP